MRLTIKTIACLLFLSGCSAKPHTDEDLASRAQEAVDRKLGTQAQFSMMESTVAQQIVCGHATAVGMPAQDFVYLDDRLILDSDVDFDHAAIQCDEAAGGADIQTDDDNSAAS